MFLFQLRSLSRQPCCLVRLRHPLHLLTPKSGRKHLMWMWCMWMWTYQLLIPFLILNLRIHQYLWVKTSRATFQHIVTEGVWERTPPVPARCREMVFLIGCSTNADCWKPDSKQRILQLLMNIRRLLRLRQGGVGHKTRVWARLGSTLSLMLIIFNVMALTSTSGWGARWQTVRFKFFSVHPCVCCVLVSHPVVRGRLWSRLSWGCRACRGGAGFGGGVDGFNMLLL